MLARPGFATIERESGRPSGASIGLLMAITKPDFGRPAGVLMALTFPGVGRPVGLLMAITRD